MNRLVMLVVLAVALVGSACSSTDGEPGSEGLDDSFYPNLGNGGYDVLHYDIDLDIDPAANTVQALTTITSRATQDLSAFNLDLSGLTVTEVQINGSHAEFSRSNTELIIEPTSSLASGSEFSTSVSYSGSPEPVVDPGVPFAALGWHHTEGAIYTVNQPSGSMSWFPSNNHPTDKATFEIRITVPAQLTAASNGILVEESSSDGYTTTTWRMDDPMATYLAAVYVGDFERIETKQPGGLLIRDYVPRDSPAEIAEALAITPQVISYYEDLLGPYPFDAYGTIVMPHTLGFAMENQTLSVHGRDTIDPLVIAHEIAHQWLGNSSTLDDWSETWLHEGFATYLSSMYMAEHHGWHLDVEMAGWHGTLSRWNSVPPMEIGNAQMFDVSVYWRGALTLHALRGLVGETGFSEILRTHYQQSANGNTNTAEFLAVVTQLAGSEAAELVESWLYDDPMPPL
ncbi:MAG: M1 family metallopeptidase [Acidimicrobiaceae bacterium]|nr:M1 family metallopeptidase [Acidimicrobiaceae bacterium]MXW75392.1 M1 family metallopeptidase [Acidimicrobiaceae bacterium]MYC41762.1 M1 family metallopeptidase [Acidimicrobiaceae bacterium]MYD07005.1 M1 family metallopeptidase [Acidimicrobiaceae bacterium]MYI58297.1 M1 family metallopeptidase [Acidimicrobiaceae bacterium]